MSPEDGLLADAILVCFSGLIGAGASAYFRRKGCTLCEATAYSLMLLLMVQSWLGQVLMMAGAQGLYLYGLLLATLVGVGNLSRTFRTQVTQSKAFLQFARSHPVPVIGLVTGWGFAAVVGAWPMVRLHGAVMENLGPIWRHAGSIFTLGRTAPDTVLPVLNHVIFTAPWQPPLAPAWANLCAYLVIGFGTYALCRRYAWPAMAITVTLLVVSMPRLVHQSLTADSELLPAAAALSAILALYRSVERIQGVDLVMLVVAIAFSVSGGRLCYLMPAVLTGLSLVLLVRRHGLQFTPSLLHDRIKVVLLTAVFAAVFSQVGVVAANLAAGRPWMGDTELDQVVFNDDPLRGTPANLARYCFLSIDLPEVIDRSCRWLFGFSLLGSLKSLYHWCVAAPLNGSGAAAPFDWSWSAPHRLAWFGPAGFLLVIPSLLVALYRGPRRLKNTALAMLAYWMLIALIVAWRPENVRLLTRFFTCSGFFMAFALSPWRLSRNGRLLLQILGVVIMAHAILT